MDGPGLPAADPSGLSPDGIVRETHQRFFHLPAAIEKREQQARREKHEQRKAKRLLHMKTAYWKTHARLTVTLSPPQSERLTARARQHGTSPTALLREAAFAFLDRQEGAQPGQPEGQTVSGAAPGSASAPPPATKGDPEVRRLGTLLNQIARHVNRNKGASLRELTACREIFTRIEQRLGGSPTPGPQTLEQQAPGTGQ